VASTRTEADGKESTMATKPSGVLRVFVVLGLSATCALGQSPPPAPGPGADLRISPQNGQTADKQWADRYECHNWSKTQSGYDPTQPGGGVAASDAATRRDEYRRSMAACLEARGYSVAYGPPAPPPPAPAPLSPHSAPAAARYAPPAPELRYHPLVVQLAAGYTLTEGANKPTLDDGGNVGLGLAWFPSSALPLGIRVDGTYSRFNQTLYSRYLAGLATNTNVAFGHQELYGGDVDAQLDLAHRSSRVKMYLIGGVGWYREQTVFKQLTQQQGLVCYFYCFPAYFDVVSTAERTTTPWLKSWNAGFGLEVALGGRQSFFVEARYRRISPDGPNDAYIPIQIGLRF
jgi:hypothetical protein